MFEDLVEPPRTLSVIPDQLYPANSLPRFAGTYLEAVTASAEERFHWLWRSHGKEAWLGEKP